MLKFHARLQFFGFISVAVLAASSCSSGKPGQVAGTIVAPTGAMAPGAVARYAPQMIGLYLQDADHSGCLTRDNEITSRLQASDTLEDRTLRLTDKELMIRDRYDSGCTIIVASDIVGMDAQRIVLKNRRVQMSSPDCLMLVPARDPVEPTNIYYSLRGRTLTLTHEQPVECDASAGEHDIDSYERKAL